MPPKAQPGPLQRPEIQLTACLTAAIFTYTMMMVALVHEWPHTPKGQALAVAAIPPQPTVPQSRHSKSNTFMLKDAFCNFTNGELVCHRAVGLRHASRLTGL